MKNAVLRVEGYPNLIKREGAVVNTNRPEYARALKRQKDAKRLDALEQDVERLHNKLDLILEKLSCLT